MMRRARRAALAVAAGLLGLSLWLPAPGRPESSPEGPRVPAHLVAHAQSTGPVRVLVELRLPSGSYLPEGHLTSAAAVLNQRRDIGSVQARVLAKLRSHGHRVRHRYATLPYLAVEVGASGLAELDAGVFDVKRVIADVAWPPALAQSVPLVQGDQLWSLGYDGTGVFVAILDTGVDSSHPFLAGKVLEEACYSSDVTGTSTTLCPNGLETQLGAGAGVNCPLSIAGCDHGTHVAGIAAGNGASAGVSFSGVARGASIMAIQVFSRFTSASACAPGMPPCILSWSSDQLAAGERVYSLRDSRTFASVNLSLGGQLFASQSACDADNGAAKTLIDNLRSVGIATVVAAGNQASTSSLSEPGCISSAISVGSTTKSDVVSSFSNVAPFLSLLAPGGSINSSLPGGSFGFKSGTSMATPHVAGAWAVLRQVSPTATVDDILAALRTTGLPIADTRSGGTVTTPRIRLRAAIDQLPALAPTIATLNPTQAAAGSGSQLLTVNGSNFVPRSVIQIGGSARTTTFVTPTQLTATLQASDVAQGATLAVRVSTAAPGGGTSSAASFTVNNPLPTMGSLSPSNAHAGGAGLTLTVLGTNFVSSSVVRWNGAARSTTFVSSTRITTAIAAGDLAVMGTTSVTVFTPTPGGGTTSATTFTIDAPTPVAGSLSPTAATVPGPSFELTVNGTSFLAASVVRWNGANRTTTFVSATTLRAAIPASDVAAPGSAAVTVFNPAPGGGTSASLTFTTTSQVLGLTLTIKGSAGGFVVSSPAGINCPPTCSANFPLNVAVLTETPGANATFSIWSGGCTGGTSTCAVTLTNTVSATFSQVFSGATLSPGSTVVDASHVTELRSAIDTLRSRKALLPYDWRDTTLTPGTAGIKSIHVLDLRTAITQAFQAAGLAAPTFTDGTITPGVTVIKAVHVNELRNAVRALE